MALNSLYSIPVFYSWISHIWISHEDSEKWLCMWITRIYRVSCITLCDRQISLMRVYLVKVTLVLRSYCPVSDLKWILKNTEFVETDLLCNSTCKKVQTNFLIFVIFRNVISLWMTCECSHFRGIDPKEI